MDSSLMQDYTLMVMKTEKDRNMNNSFIPLVIGVTGHRDICEEELRQAKEAVRSEIKKLATLCPHTPVVMLSSLAKGADQICAQVALEEKIGLTAVLPMDMNEYSKTFEGPDLDEFKRLVGLAESVFVAPFEEEEREGNDFLYRQAGIYVAHHCHILFALWNGTKASRGGCGTNEIVDIMLHGNTNVRDEGGFTADKGCVLHIPVRREKTMSEEGMKASEGTEPQDGLKPVEEEKAVPSDVKFLGDEDCFREILKRTDEFNRDSKKCIVHDKQKKGEGGSEKTNETGSAGKNAYSADKNLQGVYDLADRLSLKGARGYKFSIALIAVMATLLTTSFLLYDEANMHYLIILCGVMIAGVYAVNASDRRHGFHRKYLQYRILAEGLRVQKALNSAGVYAQVFEMMPWAIQMDTPWIVRAIAAVNLVPMQAVAEGKENPAHAASAVDADPAQAESADDAGHAQAESAGNISGFPGMTPYETGEKHSHLQWIKEQMEYHEGVVKTAAAKAKHNDRIVRTAIGITIFVYMAALLFEIFVAGLFTGDSLMDPDKAELVRTVIKLCTGSLSAMSLFAGSYYGKLSLEERANDSRRMAALYREALEREERGLETDRLCRTLAREELNENGRWFAYKSINGTDTPIS